MANPLTLLMPVVPGSDPAAIAATLAKYQQQIDDALTSVGTVHYARFLLLDRPSPNLQPGTGKGPFVLAVITAYDGDFNAYIQDFVAQLGAVFDALLAFTVGGKAVIPVADHISAFTAYVQNNDASQHAPNRASIRPTRRRCSRFSPAARPGAPHGRHPASTTPTSKAPFCAATGWTSRVISF